MESVDFYNHGCIEVRLSKSYAFICCPLMEKVLAFAEIRKIYQDLKVLELDLQMNGLKEVVGYTRLINTHVMKMFVKLGYKPFHLSLKREILWFKKELSNV